MDYVKVSFKKSKYVNIRVPEKDIFFDWLEDNRPKDVSSSVKEMRTELVWIMARDIVSYGTYYAYILYEFETSNREGSPNPVKLSESICELLGLPYGAKDPEECKKQC